jgi:hypothetical protein
VVKGSLRGITWRNNCWSKRPPEAVLGTNSQIGDPKLVNPFQRITSGDESNPFSTSLAANNYAALRNYQLTSDSDKCIGRGSNRSPANGVTPPPLDRDYWGASLAPGNTFDIGAHKFAGRPPVISAAFAIVSGQGSGRIPHTVKFADESTGERPIVEWKWNFGDGTPEKSEGPETSHTYETAGTFDVTLAVKDDRGNTADVTVPKLIRAEGTSSIETPAGLCRFMLIKDGQQVLALGTRFPNSRCIVIWNEAPHPMLNFNSIAEVEQYYVDRGQATLQWIDVPPDDMEPAGFMREEHVAAVVVRKSSVRRRVATPM